MLDQSIIIETNNTKVIKKKYHEIKGITKWIIAEFPFIQLLYPFETNPWKRMTREYTFFSNPPRNIKTPKILRYDPQNLEIIREYIDGKEIKLSEEEAMLIGKKLAKLHEDNYCLGDTKPSNFLIVDKDLYVIDAEQAINNCYEDAYKLWDALFHLFAVNLIFYWSSKKDIELYTDSLLNTYLDNVSKKYDYSSIKSTINFFSILNPLLGSRIRKILFSRTN